MLETCVDVLDGLLQLLNRDKQFLDKFALPLVNGFRIGQLRRNEVPQAFSSSLVIGGFTNTDNGHPAIIVGSAIAEFIKGGSPYLQCQLLQICQNAIAPYGFAAAEESFLDGVAHLLHIGDFL